jgi:hypothetical protein
MHKMLRIKRLLLTLFLQASGFQAGTNMTRAPKRATAHAARCGTSVLPHPGKSAVKTTFVSQSFAFHVNNVDMQRML